MAYSPVSIASDRKAVVEFEISGKRLDTFRYVESFHFELGNDTSWDSTITLFDPDWVYLEELLLGAKLRAGVDSGEARFRFGWLDLMSDWYTVSILSYTPTFTPTAGVGLEVRLTHPTTTTSNAEIYTGSFPEGTPPHRVVQILAPYIKRRYVGENLIIEQSEPYPLPIIIKEAHPLTWIQKNFCKMNPDKPVKSAVRRIAGYECTIDSRDRFHFHAPGYEETNIFREYIVARGAKGNVINFSVSDLTAFTQVAGAGKAKEEIIDHIKKKRINADRSAVGPVMSTKYSQQAATPPNVTRANKLNNKTDKPYTDPKLVKMAVEARFDTLSKATYKADLEIIGDPHIEYNKYIRVTVLKTDGSQHYTSGVYRVLNIVHDIDVSFTTKIGLVKLTEEERKKVK